MRNRVMRAFTLAEMMIVLLILSIILAAFAPMMTTRKTSTPDSYWRSDNGGATIYYGLNDKSMANIGQKPVSTDNARLIINTANNNAQNHILFKRTGTSTPLGALRLDSTNLLMGGFNQTNFTGVENTSFGLNALSQNTGGYNAAVGFGALQSNTSGCFNTAVGESALLSNTTGGFNTAMGNSALKFNTTGGSNIAVGENDLLYNTTGSNNTAVGTTALMRNTASYNTAVGSGALSSNTTGNYNSALGYMSCNNVTGSNKTCIGYNSGPTSTNSTTSEEIWIGTSASTVYIPGTLMVGVDPYTGSGVTVISNGQVYRNGGALGITNVLDKNASLYCSNSGTCLSDLRLKNIKGENKSGLDKIKQLKVFNYTFKNDKEKTPRVGVIAQDLQKVFPDAVSKDDKGYLMIRWDDMFYAMVNAIKEIGETLKQVQGDMAAFRNDIAQLKAENKALKEQNQALEARIKKLEAKLN